MLASSGQVTGLLAVRRRQQRKEPFMVVPGCVGGLLVLALEKLDGEWSSLLAKLLA